MSKLNVPHETDGYTDADVIYVLKKSNAILTAQVEALSQMKFPTMLRKQWSGAEVQEWIENEAYRILQNSGS